MYIRVFFILVKAGGMRITQHKNPKSSSNEPKLSEDSDLNSALKVSTR